MKRRKLFIVSAVVAAAMIFAGIAWAAGWFGTATSSANVSTGTVTLQAAGPTALPWDLTNLVPVAGFPASGTPKETIAVKNTGTVDFSNVTLGAYYTAGSTGIYVDGYLDVEVYWNGTAVASTTVKALESTPLALGALAKGATDDCVIYCWLDANAPQTIQGSGVGTLNFNFTGTP